jgi:hypothetical protein
MTKSKAKPQAKAAVEPEVTSDMISAGVGELARYHSATESREDAVRRIYLAMAAKE